MTKHTITNELGLSYVPVLYEIDSGKCPESALWYICCNMCEEWNRCDDWTNRNPLACNIGQRIWLDLRGLHVSVYSYQTDKVIFVVFTNLPGISALEYGLIMACDIKFVEYVLQNSRYPHSCNITTPCVLPGCRIIVIRYCRFICQLT